MTLDSPYKGLVPFEDSELDALLFFGRERESGIIGENLLAARLTVLYGPSGVGKTSVLRAGVAFRLREQARHNVEERGHPEYVVVVVDVWSEDPVDSLRSAVRDELGRQFGSALLDERVGESLAETFGRWTDALACDLLLILDQAEEHFLYHQGEGGFTAELPELVTRPGLRVRVLLSLRDDALAKLDRFKGRIPNLFANYLRLDHLDRRSARDAVEKPVERYNELVDGSIEVEPELTAMVLDQTVAGQVDLGETGRGMTSDDVSTGRIEAAYLQLVLERLWEEEQAAGSSRLRPETLVALGGAEAIVRTHLRRAVEELTTEERDVAAEVFRFLVTPSGTKIAHGVADLAEYASVEEQRLLPVLSTLNRERIVRTVNGAGEEAARYEIFHDVLGEAVLAWRREQELERERRAAERRHRRLFALAMGALVALAAMTAVAIYAFSQRANAQTESRHAHARALLAEAMHQLDIDPQLSLLLALEAAKTERTEQTQDVLSQAIESSRMRDVRRVTDTARLPAPPGGVVRIGGKALPRGAVRSVAYSPDGRIVATGHGDDTFRLWTASNGKPIKVIRGHQGDVIAIAFSPDGKLIATGSSDGTGRLWTANGEFLKPLLGHTGFVTAVAFNPRSNLVATAGTDQTVRVSSVERDQLPVVLRGHRGAVTRVRFTRNGRRILTVSTDGTERSWDPQPEPLMHLASGVAGGLQPSRIAEARGRRATIDGNDVVVTELQTGDVTRLVGHTMPVTSVRFDSTGERLVTSSEDKTVRIWNMNTGASQSALIGLFGIVNDASFSPDGRWVVAAGPFSAGLWRTSSSTIHTYLRDTDRPVAARFLSDTEIVTRARDGKVREWTCDYCGSLDELIRTARARLAQTGRGLTAEERRDFLSR